MPGCFRCFAVSWSLAACIAGVACNSLTGADDIVICDPDEDSGCSGSGSGGSSNGGSSNGGSSNGGSSSGGSSSGAGGQGGGSTFPLVLGSIGTSCSDQLPCTPGRTCLTSASNLTVTTGPAGGPQDGYCSAPCQSTADCTALDPASDCDPGIGYCLALCQTHTGGCGGPAIACAVIGTPTVQNTAEPGACVPVCGADELCEGRFCNFTTGLCQDAAPTGAEFGASCVLDSDCKGGLCLALGAFRWCTGGCVLGNSAGGECGYSTDPAVPPATVREAGCIDYNAFASQGDVGLCQELCTAPSDCTQPGFRCEPLSADESARLGRFGFCMPPDVICNNACEDADDQFCDDGGANSYTSLCALGSDCADCGPRPTPVPL